MADSSIHLHAFRAESDWASAESPVPLPRLALVPSRSNLDCWQYRFVKRGIDIAGSFFAIVLFLVPGLLIAAAITFSSRGSVFYREVRIGRGGRAFSIWKFRSMYAKLHPCKTAADPPSLEALSRLRTHKDYPDPRVTPVGRFLRKWSLDELPQLFNVFRGEMSLIGPRPIVQSELRLYSHLVGFYLAATPGISGLWQVSGRSDVAFPNRARLDSTYVEQWDLMLDLEIMLRTIPAVLCRVGAR